MWGEKEYWDSQAERYAGAESDSKRTGVRQGHSLPSEKLHPHRISTVQKPGNLPRKRLPRYMLPAVGIREDKDLRTAGPLFCLVADKMADVSFVDAFEKLQLF